MESIDNWLDLEKLKSASPAELREVFGGIQDPKVLDFLADAIHASRLDPEMRAYVAELDMRSQAELSAIMLDAMSGVPVEAAQKYQAAIERAIKGYYTHFGAFTRVLVSRSDSEYAEEIVRKLMGKIEFSEALLEAMLETGEVITPWMEEIEDKLEWDEIEPWNDYENGDTSKLEALLVKVEGKWGREG